MEEYDARFYKNDDDNKWSDAFEDFYSNILYDFDDQWREKHQDIVDDLHDELIQPASRLAKSRAVSYDSTDIDIC